MKSFIAGLALGVGLGIAFAPEPGSSTRSKLRQKANDVAQDFLPQQSDDSERDLDERAQQSPSVNPMRERTPAQTSEYTGSADSEVAGVLNTAGQK